MSFDRDVIRFRPNENRDLKTHMSTRTVPVWPQLREILQAYIFAPKGPKSGLLFPSRRTGKMLVSVRKQLDTVGNRAGFEKGEIRLHKLRHTYTAACIQTTAHGAPVALFAVASEFGQSSTNVIGRHYGHLLMNRKIRDEAVAFEVEDYTEEIAEEVLRKLRLVA